MRVIVALVNFGMEMVRREATRLLAWAALGAGAGAAQPMLERLSGQRDREAFRRWFVWLAEALNVKWESLPEEVSDCSALLRFCYREALRRHDAEWAARYVLPPIPAMADVSSARRWTAAGGAVFRVSGAPGGPLRHFADTEHLMRFNCFPVSRDLAASRPADVLFYRQEPQRGGYHSMAVTEGAVVYHTGPEGKWAGEIRRLTFAELRRHEQPRWHPVASNPGFLGVFRWNILKGPG